MQQHDPKHDADSGNDSTNQMLQQERLIDPGNEHAHDDQEDDATSHDDKDKTEHDADAGNDGTGTAGANPGQVKKEPFDTSGEDG